MATTRRPGIISELTRRIDQRRGTLNLQPPGSPGIFQADLALRGTPGAGDESETFHTDLFDADIEYASLRDVIEDASARQYLDHRNRFFGSSSAYRFFAEEADGEWQRPWKQGDRPLAELLEFDGVSSALGRKIMYRWLRKAFMEQKGVTDVPRQILAAIGTTRMNQLLKTMRTRYRNMPSSGLCPLPMRNTKQQYILGTLDDRSTGMAIDIEPDRNLVIPRRLWEIMKRVVAMSFNEQQLWKQQPRQLWENIRRLNQDFARKYSDETMRLRAVRDAAIAADEAQAFANAISARANELRRQLDAEELKTGRKAPPRKLPRVAPNLVKPAGLPRPPLPPGQANDAEREDKLLKLRDDWMDAAGIATTAQEYAEAARIFARDAAQVASGAAAASLTEKAQRSADQARAALTAVFPGGSPALQPSSPLRKAEEDEGIFGASGDDARRLCTCAKGFFSLEWELVEEFHKLGFAWGAAGVTDVALMRFELPKAAT